MVDTSAHLISKYLNPDSNSLKEHTNAGIKDGKKDLPSEDAVTYGTYENSVINEHCGAWNKYQEAKQVELDKIKMEQTSLQQEIDQKIISQQKQLQVEKTNALEKLRAISGPQSAERIHLEEQRERLKNDNDEIRTLLGRPLETHYTWFYMPFLLLLAGVEIAVNRMCFSQFFSPASSIVLALSVGAILLFIAHSSGKLLKESTCKERNPDKPKAYIAIGLLSVLIGMLIYYLSLLRDKLTDTGGDINIGIQEALAGVSEMVNIETWSLGQNGFTLLLMNTAIYAVGLVCAFYRHDPHPGYEKAEKKFTKIGNTLYKHKEKHELQAASLNESYDKKISFQTSLTTQKEAEINMNNKRLESINGDINGCRSQMANSLNQCLLAYYRGNEGERSTTKPKYWEEGSSKELVKLFD